MRRTSHSRPSTPVSNTQLLLEVLSKIEYGTSASECSIKIVALLRILKREAACLVCRSKHAHCLNVV